MDPERRPWSMAGRQARTLNSEVPWIGSAYVHTYACAAEIWGRLHSRGRSTSASRGPVRREARRSRRRREERKREPSQRSEHLCPHHLICCGSLGGHAVHCNSGDFTLQYLHYIAVDRLYSVRLFQSSSASAATHAPQYRVWRRDAFLTQTSSIHHTASRLENSFRQCSQRGRQKNIEER
ncbi:hypothetical protein IWX49DRAFT_157917 [Phyllosticta citricarpa]